MKLYAPISLILVAACSGGAEPAGGADASVEFQAELEIGVDLENGQGFAEAVDGNDAVLAAGAQGGFHVWTSPRISGAEGTVYLYREARRADDGALVLRAPPIVIDLPSEAMEDWWSGEFAIPSFMCPTPVGKSIVDTPIEFTFELTTEDEELLAKDSLTLVPRCPDGEMRDFCLEICQG